MTALVPATNFLHNKPLNPKGRPHMDGRAKPGHDDMGRGQQELVLAFFG
jgi:hypothetical protein